MKHKLALLTPFPIIGQFISFPHSYLKVKEKWKLMTLCLLSSWSEAKFEMDDKIGSAFFGGA